MTFNVLVKFNGEEISTEKVSALSFEAAESVVGFRTEDEVIQGMRPAGRYRFVTTRPGKAGGSLGASFELGKGMKGYKPVTYS